MSRGIVFKEADQRLVLLTISPDLSVVERPLTDDDDAFYRDLPDTSGDIVEITEVGTDGGVEMGMVGLKSVCAVSFFKNGTEIKVPIREVIRPMSGKEPYRLRVFIMEAKA